MIVRKSGPDGSDYADMSSDKTGEKPVRRKPEVSCARVIRAGLVEPKLRLNSVSNGQRVNNPVPPIRAKRGRSRAGQPAVGYAGVNP